MKKKLQHYVAGMAAVLLLSAAGCEDFVQTAPFAGDWTEDNLQQDKIVFSGNRYYEYALNPFGKYVEIEQGVFEYSDSEVKFVPDKGSSSSCKWLIMSEGKLQLGYTIYIPTHNMPACPFLGEWVEKDGQNPEKFSLYNGNLYVRRRVNQQGIYEEVDEGYFTFTAAEISFMPRIGSNWSCEWLLSDGYLHFEDTVYERVGQ
ncbi:MAG: hypothetical protein LBT48_02010 [Prevotellaceae bacterium]|jgi:hypothetical protein|nr:hypothetical protein [Prevotellaceae bacterium]